MSAGDGVSNAKYDFQEVYKMRGKVDNVFDYSLSDMSKLPIVDDSSRIIGIATGRKGTIKHDAIKILTDADADGYQIQAGLIVMYAKAFPQVIEEGRLFVTKPPLYSFKHNGKKVFVSNNRDYMSYLQESFSEDNKLHMNKNKLSKDAIVKFLLRNERYIECMDKLANNNATDPILMELIISNIRKIGFTKDTETKWDKLIKKEFSQQLSATWDDDCINIEGIKSGNYELIKLDEELISCKRSRDVFNLLDANMGNIYGYDISGKRDNVDLSIYQVLKIFTNYNGKDLVRYKGLGQMNAGDLKEYCMNLKNQINVQITFKDVDKAYRTLATLHSSKSEHMIARRELISNYVPDIIEIDT